jgi:hypothetical protein
MTKMPEDKFNKHDKVHHELFDENTAQIGSLGDIIEKHSRDAVFLMPDNQSVGGADGGLTDMEAEMLDSDPPGDEGMDPNDLYSADNEDQVWSTDQTGSVEGIARGFGTHLPQDLGNGGFQIEEIPNEAMPFRKRRIVEGEELDDYDDDDDSNGKYDSRELFEGVSEPGANAVLDPTVSEPTPGRIKIVERRPKTANDQFDATSESR